MLEGESQETLFKQLSLWRALPDLENNIKCGNSLIGSDYYDNIQINLLNEEELYRINVFDWEEGFPEIMQSGGFDVVIGNPPYVRPRNIKPDCKKYFRRRYSTFVKKANLYCCFVEKSSYLLKSKGLFGQIISNGWLRLDSFEELRKLLLGSASIKKIIEFSKNIFRNANVKTAILIYSKDLPQKSVVEVVCSDSALNLESLKFKQIQQILFESTYKYIFDLSIDSTQEIAKQKIKKRSVPLESIFQLSFGLKTGDDARFLSYSFASPAYKPLLRGEDIHRYASEFKGEYVWYVPDKMRLHRKTARPGNSERFEQPKVLIRDTGGKLEGTFDTENYYVKDVLIVSDQDGNSAKLKLLIGIINSKLMKFYYETSFPTLHVQRNEIASLPICIIPSLDITEKAKHDRIVQLVEQMLTLHQKLAEAKTPPQKSMIQKQINVSDRQIDQLVYELYELTAEEIAIVEGK